MTCCLYPVFIAHLPELATSLVLNCNPSIWIDLTGACM